MFVLAKGMSRLFYPEKCRKITFPRFRYVPLNANLDSPLALASSGFPSYLVSLSFGTSLCKVVKLEEVL